MQIDIIPDIGHRAFGVGQTGSGKTSFILEKVLDKFYEEVQIQIMATKEDDKILSLDAPIVTRLSEVDQYETEPMVVYYPSGEELGNKEYLDAWCEWCYLRKNTVAYIDELTQVVTSTTPPPGFLDLYTRGRSQNVTAIAGTQLPSGIPRIVYTEAQFVYKFYLADSIDRSRVARFTTQQMKRQVPDRHGFHVYAPVRGTYDVIYVPNKDIV